MKSISVTILALVLLPAGLAPAAPPVRPAAAANTSGPLDPEQICQQSTAANIAAYKRFARKLKASAKYFLEIEDVEGRPPLPPGGDARIKNQVLQSLSRCYKTGEGAVYIALQSISGCWSDACQEEESVKIRTSLLFAKGTQRIAVPLPVGIIYNSPGQDVYNFHSLAGAFDYDGDGVPEVLVMNQEYERGEGGEHRTFKLQSIKDGKLVDYPYSPPLREDSRMEDFDKDGRPDFYSPGTYAPINVPVLGAGDDRQAVPSQFVYHSLPGGRFSSSDSVAQAAVAKRCPAPQNLSLAAIRAEARAKNSRDEDGAIIQAVICARAQGKPADEVLQAIQRDCHHFLDDGIWKWENVSMEWDGVVKPHSCPTWLRQVIVTPSPLAPPGTAMIPVP